MSNSSTRSSVAVVVPAAGRGTRLGGPPKQFRTVEDRSVLFHTLRIFEALAEVHQIAVAVSPEYMATVNESARTFGVTKLVAVVEGGASRQESVARVLEALPPEVDLVLVHDAVRPFVQPATITSVVEAARAHGAAAPALPVVDTLRAVEDGWFGETVPRRGLFRMQTPQGFRRDWLEAAHRQASAEDPATDDVELLQRLGHRVHHVAGHARNIKITTPEDWELAQQLWADTYAINA